MKVKKKILIAIVASIGFTMFFACNTQPNNKLKIEDKRYTISLGEVNYDVETSLLTIEVLADGKPMKNSTQYLTTTRNIGAQEIISTSSSQPVRMMLMLNGRGIFANEGISSEDGKFTFNVEEVPDIIEVFTDTKNKNIVHFNAKTKEIMPKKEYELYMQKWIRINNSANGLD